MIRQLIKGIFIFLLFFFVNPTSHAIFFEPNLEFNTITTEHFYIHYPKNISSVAYDVMQVVEPVYQRITTKFKWKPWGRIHVVLSDKTDVANGLATVIPSNYLLLYVTPPDVDSPLDFYRDYLELLFTHELSHIIHIDQHHRMASPVHWIFGKIVAPNGLTPGWMREGIATWQESVETGRGRANFSYSDMMVRTSVYENKFPHLSQLAGLRLKWPSHESQYIFGVKFWQWLAKKYGEERIQKFAEEYASGLWLFSLNNKARRVYGKSFYKLWKEWEEELKVDYEDLRNHLTIEGLTSFELVTNHKDFFSYPIAYPAGQGYAYVQEGYDEASKIVIVNENQTQPTILKKAVWGQLAFSHDGGKKLAFSSVANIEKYHLYSEIYVYDFEKKTTTRVYAEGEEKISLRAMDPDFSPLDGGDRFLVMVRSNQGTDNLYIYDLQKKKGYPITDAAQYTQFSNPRFSPDGRYIVVSERDYQGDRNLVLYTQTGTLVKKITDDQANDMHPTWSGNFIYYASDKTGISNIYRVDPFKGSPVRITNVLTGVYQPALTSDGQLLVRYYTADGFKIYKTFIGHHNLSTSRPLDFTTFESLLESHAKKVTDEEVMIEEAKKYSAFPQVLVPRQIVPTLIASDESFLIGLTTGRFDPLYRHSWLAFAHYRSDASFIGGGARYSYLRYNPGIHVGVLRYSLNWGDIFGVGEDFFEKRHQGYVSTSFSKGYHQTNLSYYYELRDNLTSIPAGFSFDLEPEAGLRLTYLYSLYKTFPNSISQEDGLFFKLVFDFTHSIFGSSNINERETLVGDFRYYFEMPWSDHHVLALRAAAGWVWGDVEQIGGTFRFGGPFGEGALAGYSSQLFPFRGLPGVTFARDRVILTSLEYRFPLVSVERGIGTWPIYLRRMHLGVFTDFGDTWFRDGKDLSNFFDDFLLSVGAELRSDLEVGYGLPLTARLGYAVIVLNRDRIAGLTDATFGNDLKYGSFYLSFGTSF